MRHMSEKKTRDKSSWNRLNLAEWLAIMGVLAVIWGGGAWAVHAFFDYNWAQSLLLSPVFIVIVILVFWFALY